jgi:hypothetical protein
VHAIIAVIIKLMAEIAELFARAVEHHRAGRFPEATECYRRVVELNPTFTEAYNNLGTVLQVQGKLDQALECYRQALLVNPNYAEAYNNLGLALRQEGRLEEAAHCFQRAVELNDELAEAHLNRATLWLLKGDYQRGWPEHEWLWKTNLVPRRVFSQPVWKGEPLAGRTILLHSELGFGDTFHFIRYAPLVKRLGATVVVECQKGLVNLLGRCAGIDRLIGRGDDLPEYDAHAAFFSLPVLFRTTLDSIPGGVPYLYAEERLSDVWRTELSAVSGMKVGVNWRGGSGPGIFGQRDFPLECFAALSELPDVHLISLQKDGHDDLAAHCGRLRIFEPRDLDEAHGAFMDTAALMMNLDLVITCDTSVAHLAGALGVPVWVALPFIPDWRWLLNRSDSPWYPTMRLFRQERPGDWAGVFRQIEVALRERNQ